LFENSEVIVVTQKNPNLDLLINKYKTKYIVDLVRINNQFSSDVYEGICW
jgi:hypothetical protein